MSAPNVNPTSTGIFTSSVASKVISAPESISAITGVVKVLLVSVDVEASDTKVESPPVLGIVKTLLALSECAAAFICCP